MASPQGTTATSEQATGMRDEMYDVVSVLYHALQGSETCRRYLHDAERHGDQELQQFFQEVQECQRHLATRAKEMLKQRLSRGNGQGASMGQSQHAHQGAAGSMAGAGTSSPGSTGNQGRNNR